MALSIGAIYTQTRKFRGYLKFYPRSEVKITSIKRNSSGILVNANVQGRKVYKVNVLMVELEPSEKKTKLKVTSGSKVWYCPLPTPKTRVRFRCTCPDFKYPFSEPLRKRDSLYGEKFNFDEVQGTGKPRNPKGYLGTCKHCISVTQVLMNPKK